jgi:hypothetical protein
MKERISYLDNNNVEKLDFAVMQCISIGCSIVDAFMPTAIAYCIHVQMNQNFEKKRILNIQEKYFPIHSRPTHIYDYIQPNNNKKKTLTLVPFPSNKNIKYTTVTQTSLADATIFLKVLVSLPTNELHVVIHYILVPNQLDDNPSRCTLHVFFLDILLL